MNTEQKANGGIFSKVIVILLVLNLALSCGVVGYLVLNNSKGDETQLTATSGEEVSIEYVLNIGTNDKDTYKQEIPTEEARKIINDICAKYVDGYSSYDAHGAWADEKGVYTEEVGFVYIFAGATREQIQSIMDEILTALNQNSIMVETKESDAFFYDGTSDDWCK